MKLFWTPEAAQDRDEIYNYIEADNPVAALALDELFERKAGSPADYPGLGRSGRMAGTRELVVHANYILVYDLVGGIVRVLRIVHAARQWPKRPSQPPSSLSDFNVVSSISSNCEARYVLSAVTAKTNCWVTEYPCFFAA
ncbi:type II toxin-antitoxin system RelE/ParE family toxin [Alcaligenaceae bacterium]|nr:type II toxin-antitoxin system RelE/ParE family toxin [Alcaligenaceae bacterium]